MLDAALAFTSSAYKADVAAKVLGWHHRLIGEKRKLPGVHASEQKKSRQQTIAVQVRVLLLLL